MTELVLFDSHCHIDAEEFSGDRAEVLERASAAGIGEMLLVGAADSADAARKTVEFARERSGLYPTVGVHPHHAHSVDAAGFEAIAELASRPEVVAVGESGLDFFYDSSPRDAQAQAFERHIDLALAVCKPLICHIRDAHDEARRLLRRAADQVPVVIHCFTGTPEDARQYIELGFVVSFSGIVTFKGQSAEPIRAAVREVPLEQMLIETDAPYLAPVPLRGKRNEPSFLIHTAQAVAQQAAVDLGELAARTTANARRVFALTAS